MQLKTGNLFSTNCDIICHGVNCRGAFGSGVAGQIARLFPLVKEEYVSKFKTESWKLGDVQFVYIWDSTNSNLIKTFANCATQLNYGSDGKQYLNYAALGVCLNTVFDYAQATGKSVAMPKIGCGLAGGEWSMVSSIIEQCLQDRKIHLEVWEF